MTTLEAPVEAPARTGRLAHLDGLRGAAALVVLVYHGFLVIPGFANPEWGVPDTHGLGWLDYSPLRILLSGTEAVLIFFVLSGFVLTLPVIRSATFSWKAYYPSRVVRLYLPVVGALVWSAAVILVLPRMGLDHDPSPYLRDHVEVLTPLKLLRDAVLVDGVNSVDGPLWSLQWEVVFSLLLPLYVFIARRVRRAWLPLTIVIAVVSAVASVADRPALTYLPAFGIGVLFAVSLDRIHGLCDHINVSARSRAIWTAVVVVASFLLTARWTLGPLLPVGLLGLTQFAVLLGAALFVFVALGSPLAHRLLTTKALRWLGLISFSLYLTHEAVVVGIAQLLPARAESFSVLLATPVSLLVGWGFYRVVEMPAHRLSQWIKRSVTATSKRPV